jgi:ribosomal protein S18 acetylase RimI-like enzyme
MASGDSIEILDLRHFSAAVLRPVLDAETEVWKQRLHWDYRASIRLLMQYVDSRSLPGFAALDIGHLTGYAFCVYEETKALIGGVFSPPSLTNRPYAATISGPDAAQRIEQTLLRHIFELLINSPQVNRIESQLLLHPSGTHTQYFRDAGFQIYRRLFMVQPLKGMWNLPRIDLPGELELRLWRDDDLGAAAQLITDCYYGHADSAINDQYRTVYGSQRFLNNIVRFSGCGVFSAPVSHVVAHRRSRELVALVLGSRVSPESGHITQLCVRPEYRRRGIARMLLSLAAFHFMRLGVAEISLTVTEANAEAIELYRAEGYDSAHSFDAAVWQRSISA